MNEKAAAAAVAVAAVAHSELPTLENTTDLKLTAFSTVSSPLFIVREWDEKVIRTIGHKPKCKASNNMEQALRSCVRQGVLSLNLNTMRATKEQIQQLKSVGVLGKRAPSASLINTKELLALCDYFSQTDIVADLRSSIIRVSTLMPSIIHSDALLACLSPSYTLFDTNRAEFRINLKSSLEVQCTPPAKRKRSSSTRLQSKEKESFFS